MRLNESVTLREIANKARKKACMTGWNGWKSKWRP